MDDVTSHPLANQAEACLIGRSLNTSLCEIYDHIKQHFCWSKQSYTNISFSKKCTDIIDLCYNIEECLAANDYFTD